MTSSCAACRVGEATNNTHTVLFHTVILSLAAPGQLVSWCLAVLGWGMLGHVRTRPTPHITWTHMGARKRLHVGHSLPKHRITTCTRSPGALRHAMLGGCGTLHAPCKRTPCKHAPCYCPQVALLLVGLVDRALGGAGQAGEGADVGLLEHAVGVHCAVL